MTEHLNTPVVTIPLMVTIGTGTNAGYVDFTINPEDLDPPDEEFWKDKESFHYVDTGRIEKDGPLTAYVRYRLAHTTANHYFYNPPTKAHAKMLIHLLTGRNDLWSSPNKPPTMPMDGQGGETT